MPHESYPIQLIVAPADPFSLSLSEFKIYLRSERRSPRTISAYLYHLDRLRLWLVERGIVSPDQVLVGHLREWKADLFDTWAPATVRQACAAAKAFFAWTEQPALCAVLKVPRVRSGPQRTLTIEEVGALLAVCDGGAKGLRDRALMSLLLDSGLRSAEVCRVKVSDLEFGVMILPGIRANRIVIEVKGGDRRPAYFGKATAEALRRWLDVRRAIDGSLFVGIGGTQPGQGITPDGLRAILRKIGDAAGVSGVSPHAFRRAFACLLEQAGASTREVQELGRWSNLDMVLLYTRDYRAAVKYPAIAPLDFIARQSGRADS